MKSVLETVELGVSNALAEYRRRRDQAIAVRELERLSDRLLRDIGIERADIRKVVSELAKDGRQVTRDVSALGGHRTAEAGGEEGLRESCREAA